MNFMEELAEKVLMDDYFKELFLKAEKRYTLEFFGIEVPQNLSEKEYIDFLRFADILSHSESADAKNLAYKVLSLLYEYYKVNKSFLYFSRSILTKLGNFPAMSLIDKKIDMKIKEPLEKVFEKTVKEVYQKDPNSKYIFTDSQYKIFESLKASNHYSFSGPTSLGKSFLIEAFIKFLINEHNSKDNLVILVPTRALINQVTNRLKHEVGFDSGYKILSHPTIPSIFKLKDYKYIFVFTPERLISYLSEPTNPKIDYLFIDEAQKVVSFNDTRSPLYYHAILQAERKSVKLFFSSPNISNSEIFLQLFEKSTNESLSIKESPVSQNRFFLDLLDKRLKYFSDIGMEIDYRLSNKGNLTFNDWLIKLGLNTKNLIYCNTVNDTIEYAKRFSETLPNKENKNLNELILLIKEYIHEDYYLIDCLQKGVAFHFGKLPQRIRERIELLFSEEVIDYVFCTSTLLEGVNLPAKNIFILSNAIGASKFIDIDFWNLAGRAGRLAKELSGNIICVRLEDKRNRWANPEKDLEVVRNKSIKKIEPVVIKGQKNFFENIGRSLSSEKFTVKRPSQEQTNIWDHYANIAFIHEVRKDESVLKSNFIKNNKRAKEILKAAQKDNKIPDTILAQSSTIKIKYQNLIYNRTGLDELTLPLEVDYKTTRHFLGKLYDFYNWAEEESGGRNPLARSKKRLNYFAYLMNSWINSKPLNVIIVNLLRYHEKEGEIWVNNQYIPFVKNDRSQLNLIINSVISDIDSTLRFKLKNYFLNYYLILKDRLGTENCGENWAEFLEYGTTDKKLIELQNVGFERHLASFILENHEDCLVFENGDLVDIDEVKLSSNMDPSIPEFQEVLKALF